MNRPATLRGVTTLEVNAPGSYTIALPAGTQAGDLVLFQSFATGPLPPQGQWVNLNDSRFNTSPYGWHTTSGRGAWAVRAGDDVSTEIALTATGSGTILGYAVLAVYTPGVSEIRVSGPTGETWWLLDTAHGGSYATQYGSPASGTQNLNTFGTSWLTWWEQTPLAAYMSWCYVNGSSPSLSNSLPSGNLQSSQAGQVSGSGRTAAISLAAYDDPLAGAVQLLEYDATWAGNEGYGVYTTLALDSVLFTLRPPSFVAGCDLAQDHAGILYRAYRSGANVKVGRSIDAGASWVDVTAATDAATDAAPTLCLDIGRNMLVWYHTTAGDAKARISTDLGATWADFATHAGVRFPRARRLRGSTYLVGYVGTGLTVYTSDDCGETVPSAYTIAGLSAQLAALEFDRHGILHLVYRDADGALQHRYGKDGANWSDASEWAAAGQYPGLGIGPHEGLFSYYTPGGALVVKLLTDGFDAPGDTLTVPSGSYAPGYHGLLVDSHRDLWSLGQQYDGTPEHRFSKDMGSLW